MVVGSATVPVPVPVPVLVPVLVGWSSDGRVCCGCPGGWANTSRSTFATPDGCGTLEVMRRSGKTKPVVWRWQERHQPRR